MAAPLNRSHSEISLHNGEQIMHIPRRLEKPGGSSVDKIPEGGLAHRGVHRGVHCHRDPTTARPDGRRQGERGNCARYSATRWERGLCRVSPTTRTVLSLSWTISSITSSPTYAGQQACPPPGCVRSVNWTHDHWSTGLSTTTRFFRSV